MIHFTSFIHHDNGRKVFFQTWHPEGTPRATVLLAHGYAEHSGRYDHVAEFLTEKGYAVYAPDHYGHGHSDGIRGDVPYFEMFTTDLYKLYTIARNKEKNDIFLFGHSMGGAIGAHFAILYPDSLKGLILSGAGIRVTADVSPLLKTISSVIAAILPALPVVAFDLEGISRNQEVIQKYRDDPLTYTGKVRARMGRELLRVEKLTSTEALSKITVPVLLLHGEEDRVVNPECSKIIYNSVSSTDKELAVFPGLFHEILNSADKSIVLQRITTWLDSHTGNKR